MKKIYILILLNLSISCSSNQISSNGETSNLSAPKLGITSSSILLLWDDTFTPDYTSNDKNKSSKTYYIFQNDNHIGTTTKLSFPVYDLTPSTTYNFRIQSSINPNSVLEKNNQIDATTKSAGKVFNVKQFGAVGDGKTRDTKAIQEAIDACTKNGTVTIPKGTYIVGPLKLKSNITLELKNGSRLNFIGYNEGENYPAIRTTLPGPDGDIEFKKNYLITGYKLRNVTITGKGIINGNGETWWPHYKKFKVERNRPFMLGFIQSSNILVQGITFQDPPAWNNHLLYADSVLYSDVTFKQVSTVQGHNADGMDADASWNILVVGCLFATQDDSFAIKSGRYTSDGNKRRRSTEYVTVRDCIFNGTISAGATTLGLAIGSEVSGGARHILIKNCEFIDVASIINIKTNRSRPYAIVEDIRVENCIYTNNFFPEKAYNRAPIAIDMFYYGEYANPDSVVALNKTTPLFRNIHFKNIKIENNKGMFTYLRGMPEQPMQNITFENISGRAIKGFYGKDINGITLKNVKFASEDEKLFNWTRVENISQTIEQ